MTDWRQKIEAQIARERYTGKVELSLDEALALLGVAVAADTEWTVHGLRENSDLLAAVRKLREVTRGTK